MTAPTDWRALCAIAVELWDADCGMESVLEQMRTALAQPEPQGPTDEELREMWLSQQWFNEGATFREFASIVRRWGRPTIEPVPVAERPWEQEGWCDDSGWCWGFDADDTDPYWSFDKPEQCPTWTHLLPHHALPLPAAEAQP